MTLKLAKFANLSTMLMDISEFMQQDGRKKRTAKCMCVTDLTSYCLHVLLWFTLMFSGLLQKDLFKGGWSLAKNFFKPNYCHACHTRFSIFFPLPPCCVSSLLLLVFITTWKKKTWKDLWTQTSRVFSPTLEFWNLRTNQYHFWSKRGEWLRMGPSNSLLKYCRILSTTNYC